MLVLQNNYGPKTRKQIAGELNISTRTLSRYIRRFDLDVPHNRMLIPREYEPIYAIFKNSDQ